MITMKFNKGMAAKQRENQMTESRPGSNITLGICTILLCGFCDTSQASNAPKENRTLGQILNLVRNTDCKSKSKTMRWNTLCFPSLINLRFPQYKLYHTESVLITLSRCGVGRQELVKTSPAQAELHCTMRVPDPPGQNHFSRHRTVRAFLQRSCLLGGKATPVTD